MDQRPRPIRMTASEVEARLANAGQALLALPHAGCFPAGFRTLWPGYDEASPNSHFLPSPAEISAMDEAYRWVGLLPDVDERRLVLMRSLVRPGLAGSPRRYVWSWRRLRKSTGRHPDTLKAIWGRGIDRIARALNSADRRAPSDGRVAAGRYTGASWLRDRGYGQRP